MRGRDWTMTELKDLREKYPLINTETLAKQMGRSTTSLFSMAQTIGVKKEKRDWVNQGNFKLGRVLKLAQFLLHKPKGISEIMRAIDISNRTAYRYLHLLSDSGFEVGRQRTKYIINNIQCPLCGKKTNNHTNEH